MEPDEIGTPRFFTLPETTFASKRGELSLRTPVDRCVNSMTERASPHRIYGLFQGRHKRVVSK